MLDGMEKLLGRNSAHISCLLLILLGLSTSIAATQGSDLCPSDPLKTAPGVCGCGVPETNPCDDCPANPNKTVPGVCGCNAPDVDSDNDGFLDCVDGCPHDFRKTQPGLCGCGVLDYDTDGDGTPDCKDGCPADPMKLEPGLCGCNQIEQKPCDQCPDDPNKTSPGVCGCGIPDRDINNNGVVECPTDVRPETAINFGMGVLYEDAVYSSSS